MSKIADLPVTRNEGHHRNLERDGKRDIGAELLQSVREMKAGKRGLVYDLRIRHEQLRATGNIGDILILKAAPPGTAYDYDFEVVRSTDARFVELDAACTVRVAANSQKRYGYI